MVQHGNLVDILQAIDDLALGVDTNFATNNLTASGDRTHNWSGNNLTINNLGSGGNSTLALEDSFTVTSAAFAVKGSGASASQLQVFEPGGVNAITFVTPNLAGNNTYTWPSAPPAVSGYVLSSTTGGVMSWEPISAPGDTNFANTNLVSDNNRQHTFYRTYARFLQLFELHLQRSKYLSSSSRY